MSLNLKNASEIFIAISYVLDRVSSDIRGMYIRLSLFGEKMDGKRLDLMSALRGT